MKNIKVRQHIIPLWPFAICLILGFSGFFLSGLWNLSGFWKIDHRETKFLLGDPDSSIPVQVHVLGKPAKKFLGFQVLHLELPTEEEVSVLSNVPHTHFYASHFGPTVTLTIKRRHLIFITSLPFVRYVRILLKPMTS